MKTVAEYLLEMRVAGYEDFGVDVKKTNFAKVAVAVGIRGIRVENSGDLKSSLEDALRHKGPVLVDVGRIPMRWPYHRRSMRRKSLATAFILPTRPCMDAYSSRLTY
jgi:thiamine pyrophosphate-dependent acetolactate synthase large subunit-like protein